jgi:3-deoxy-7-phosphoheptulonate synthase
VIIVMEAGSSWKQIETILHILHELGLQTHVSQGTSRTVIGVLGNETRKKIEDMSLSAMPGVEKIISILKPYVLASREFKKENTIIKIGEAVIGSDQLQVIAGPCAIESESQALETAFAVKNSGATLFRGGAFKPRTSPYSFQGLGEKALKILAKVKSEVGLPIVTEVMDTDTLPLIYEYADILQIGTRNMQNYQLLKSVGKLDKPVLLKRGTSASVEEWLLAAEYILSNGNQKVILCERGIRTFAKDTRYTLDLSVVPVIKCLTHLPIIVDPSHSTGKWQLVAPLAKAAVAVGADGLLIEVHPNPENALSDGAQSLTISNFECLMNDIKKIALAVDKKTTF